MNNSTGIKYRGNVEVTLQNTKANKVVARYHNKGTRYLFQSLCKYLMSGVANDAQNTLPKVTFIQATAEVGIDTYQILNVPVHVSTQVEISEDSVSLVATGSLYYRDINFTKLNEVLNNYSKVKLFLYLMPQIGYSGSGIADYALAKVETLPNFFTDLEPGVQATIQWTMTFSSDEGDE